MPVTQFWNNSAHSNGAHGLYFYPTYQPFANGCSGGSTSPQYISNFSTWRNGGYGVYGNGNAGASIPPPENNCAHLPEFDYPLQFLETCTLLTLPLLKMPTMTFPGDRCPRRPTAGLRMSAAPC